MLDRQRPPVLPASLPQLGDPYTHLSTHAVTVAATVHSEVAQLCAFVEPTNLVRLIRHAPVVQVTIMSNPGIVGGVCMEGFKPIPDMDLPDCCVESGALLYCCCGDQQE